MEQAAWVNTILPGKTTTQQRILFATVPADGHFNPLTGLAVHLKGLGYDVRWYTSGIYADKLNNLLIPHYTFKKALDVNAENADTVFPERKLIKGQVKKLNFDLVNGFILRSVEYYEDIKDIYAIFPFDLVICDCMFMALPFIKEKMQVPVVSAGIIPLTASSKDLPPAGLGLTPATTFFGKRKQDLLRLVTDKLLFGKSGKIMRGLLQQYAIEMEGKNIFDMLVRKASLLLQSGVPGFDYKRSDIGRNIRFAGALLPYAATGGQQSWHHEKMRRYNKIILVTQGTAEKDVSKLLVPTLEAFKNSSYLVIATTGGAETASLQARYRYDNIIIENFIPFADIMPYADAYITNGGYGGVMLGIQHKLPMVVAGIHEGKNEINARVGYFKLGINLRTERPSLLQIKKSVEKIIADERYRSRVKRLALEFSTYQPNELCTRYIGELLQGVGKKKSYSANALS